ncbi:MAG: outer membrane protein assembly factor BamD, partial [Bacteroidales bacterium]
QPLLEQLQMVYRGTVQDDTLQYYLGLSNYHLNDYVTAEDNFRQFVEIFPRSPFTKMARFLRLDCLYQSTYRYALDQQPSHITIAAIEEFLYDYPGSEYTTTCHNMLDDLYLRLDRKAFESAKLYYTIEDYKAASHALKETLKENPENHYREEIMYYIVAAHYQYAVHSVPESQRERFLNVIDEYYNFVSEFPDSKYTKEVGTMFKKAQQVTTKKNNTEE